ncbi:MAG TPA: hypothetical protein PLW39_14775 [Thermoflexales bacterium]|nr:hypothetical protein [Thermoflexales bacterium]
MREAREENSWFYKKTKQNALLDGSILEQSQPGNAGKRANSFFAYSVYANGVWLIRNRHEKMTAWNYANLAILR